MVQGGWFDGAGANYRSVWALHKHFPNVKIYVRAHDVSHGLNLEKVMSPSSSSSFPRRCPPPASRSRGLKTLCFQVKGYQMMSLAAIQAVIPKNS